MPTYSYACTACEHRFDTVQTFTDVSLTDCPECAGRLRKLFSSVGIVFKGSGFYRTDSRAAQPAESGSSDKPQTGADSKSTSDKSSAEKGNSEKSSSDTSSSGKPSSEKSSATSNSKSSSTRDSSGGSSGGSASSSANARTASTPAS